MNEIQNVHSHIVVTIVVGLIEMDPYGCLIFSARYVTKVGLKTSHKGVFCFPYILLSSLLTSDAVY